MQPLFPEIKPYARHRLQVDALHNLYVDESGNTAGLPVVFLHGGPGSGCEVDSRRFFDPAVYRIILVDQRGSGRSTPQGETEHNTLHNLIKDLEQIRELLAVPAWVIFGGGWGSTLALAYAEHHPAKVLGLILRGVFLGRQADIDWIYKDGAKAFFPEHWADFMAPILSDEPTAPCESYRELMASDNDLVRMTAAKAWSVWEAHCANLHPNARLLNHYAAPHRALTRCRIGTHYMVNGCFLEPNQILAQAGQLKDIPGIIVQGRFDVLTPMAAAHALQEHWPGSEILVVREAGHSATEPAMIDALLRATKTLAQRLDLPSNDRL